MKKKVIDYLFKLHPDDLNISLVDLITICFLNEFLLYKVNLHRVFSKWQQMEIGSSSLEKIYNSLSILFLSV